MYPKGENMIMVPIRKRMKIITSILVCLISSLNFDYKENGLKKSFFFQIQSINTVYPNREYVIVEPIKKRIEISMSMQVCLNS